MPAHVIARSEATKQSPAWRAADARAAGDCLVASLLAMTAVSAIPVETLWRLVHPGGATRKTFDELKIQVSTKPVT